MEEIDEWIRSTKGAIIALQVWKAHLEEWRHSGEAWPGQFDCALNTLRQSGLESWADRNEAGLDALAAAVEGGLQ